MEQAYTNINSLGLFLIICFGTLSFVLPRRLAFLPLLLTACYVTIGQTVVVSGINLHGVRLIILGGVIRILLRSEYRGFEMNTLDKVFIAWQLSRVLTYSVLYGTIAAFANRMGYALDILGSYLIVRSSVRDIDDVALASRTLAVTVIPLVLIMIFESRTGTNLFAAFGGVPETSQLREPGKITSIISKVRCQGVFRHPILAGSIGAALFTLFAGLWFQKPAKRIAIVGMIGASVITLVSASSGPLLSFCGGIVALGLWPWRKNMRLIRWALVLLFSGLHLLMSQPVWYIMARLGGLFGGTGWHRSYLIDQTIAHFSEWWLIGTQVTVHWMPTGLPVDSSSSDITSQYVYEAVNGGIVTLALFISVIVVAFRQVGRLVRKESTKTNVSSEFFMWALGGALLSHVITFLSVAYFDQSMVFWSLTIAFVASCNPTNESKNRRFVSLTARG